MKRATVELTDAERGFMWGVMVKAATQVLREDGLDNTDPDLVEAFAVDLAKRIESDPSLAFTDLLEELRARFASKPWPEALTP